MQLHPIQDGDPSIIKCSSLKGGSLPCWLYLFDAFHNTEGMSPFLELHHLFRLLQRRNKFILRDDDTGLGLSELFILIELENDKKVSTKTLAEILKLDRSTVTRTIQKLHQKNLLIRTPSNDRRIKQYRLSAQAHQLLDKSDTLSEKRAAHDLSHLSKKEVTELLHLFRKLNAGANIKEHIPRRTTSPLRIEMRRLTYALHILDPKFMDSSLSSSQYLILAEILHNPECTSSLAVMRQFDLSQSSVSLLLKHLQNLGFVQLVPALHDSRMKLLEVTKKGEAHAALISLRAEKLIQSYLAGVSSTQITYGLQAFRKLLLVNHQKSAESYTLKVLLKESELTNARVLMVRASVRDKTETMIGEIIASSRFSYVVGAFQAKKMVGVIEFAKDGQLTLRHVFFDKKDAEVKLHFERQARQFVQTYLLRS